jgi:hypothetical protein
MLSLFGPYVVPIYSAFPYMICIWSCFVWSLPGHNLVVIPFPSLAPLWTLPGLTGTFMVPTLSLIGPFVVSTCLCDPYIVCIWSCSVWSLPGHFLALSGRYLVSAKALLGPYLVWLVPTWFLYGLHFVNTYSLL